MGGYANNKQIVTDGLSFIVDPANGLSDDGTSTVKDLSGGLSLTKYNTITTSTDGGVSWGLSSGSDRIGCSTNVMSGKSNFSMGAWAKPFNNTSDGTVFGRWANGEDVLMLWWDVGGTSNFRLIARDSSTGGALFTSDTTACGTVNQWNHILFTWDAANNEIKLYLNGVLNQTATNNSLAIKTGTTGFGIGNQYGTSGSSNRTFNGVIGPVYAYDKTLTASEVAHNYDTHKNRFS